MKREYAIDKLIENADKCTNMLELCHKMGIENVGGNDYKEIRNLAKKLNINLVFSYKKNTVNQYHSKLDIQDILVENSKYQNTAKLKTRLIKCGLKEYKCECCGLTEWNNKPIPLQIHHINGIHNDNRIENIQILCANCHAQTDNYCGKNVCKDKTTKYSQFLTKKYLKKEHWQEFLEKRWVNNHPTKETLCKVFKEVGSFSGVGKLYNVTDNAIKKWFKHYNLPTKKKELKKYLGI